MAALTSARNLSIRRKGSVPQTPASTGVCSTMVSTSLAISMTIAFASLVVLGWVAYSSVVVIFKEQIITVEMPPGSIIHEAQLMQELDLGRTPIREALKRQIASGTYDRDRPIVVPMTEDRRYRSWKQTIEPETNAVVLYMMDVSGSMDESRKDLSKRFFILLYLFLTRHYEKIDIVFIRHHTQAQEVDEQNFFHATETGFGVLGTAGANGSRSRTTGAFQGIRRAGGGVLEVGARRRRLAVAHRR